MKYTKITLAGFMGAGKTGLGKKMAPKIGFLHIDLDKEIEKFAQKSITEIVEERGENYFRELEAKLLYLLLISEKKLLISLGGGTLEREENRQIVFEKSISIYLKNKPKILFRNLKNARNDSRFLIKNLTDQELKAFIVNQLEERAPNYEQCSITIEVKGKYAKQFSGEIIEKLQDQI